MQLLLRPAQPDCGVGNVSYLPTYLIHCNVVADPTIRLCRPYIFDCKTPAVGLPGLPPASSCNHRGPPRRCRQGAVIELSAASHHPARPAPAAPPFERLLAIASGAVISTATFVRSPLSSLLNYLLSLRPSLFYQVFGISSCFLLLPALLLAVATAVPWYLFCVRQPLPSPTAPLLTATTLPYPRCMFE